MRVGIPKEIKVHEYRVGLPPEAVGELVHHGHEVLVQASAGVGIGADDSAYEAVGARIVPDPAALFEQAEMVVKVKEPQAAECRMLRPGQLLFTYLHLAADPQQAEGLRQSGCSAVAYETVTDARGQLPLLAPMSEVAGRMAIQVGAVALQKAGGGRGVLLGGVPGVAPGHVVVIGGGNVGTHAARMAVGLGARVTVLDRSLARLRELDELFQGRVQTQYPTVRALEAAVLDADLVVGAVLVPGAAAPKLLRRATLQRMRAGSVVVDVSIDQGGCFETSHPTTHDQPTYIEAGIVHYCVANMPGAVARSSAYALSHATLPFVLQLADRGLRQACADDEHLLHGLNVHRGQITHAAVAQALGLPLLPARQALGLQSG